MSAFPEADAGRLGETTSAAAARLVRAAILDGCLEAGPPVARDRALARSLGISRTPVREALRLLENEGLVETAPNRAATVKRYKSYMAYSEENRRAACDDHRAIAEALRARDGDRAGELLERHILWARDLAIAQLLLIASAPRGASAG